MENESKYYETGSSPYYIDLNNTAKDFSFQDISNPRYGFLETLNNNMIIDDTVEIEEPIVFQDLIIEK